MGEWNGKNAWDTPCRGPDMDGWSMRSAVDEEVRMSGTPLEFFDWGVVD